MINFEELKPIRIAELGLALQHFPPAGRVLEVGAGAGWQAKLLSDKGYQVSAIDVQDGGYIENEEFPVTKYDGSHIPFPDGYFDVVFSSNVLEHIPHIDEIQKEIKRVLKNDGVAVHLVPTNAWKFWASIMFYPMLVRMGTRILLSRLKLRAAPENKTFNETALTSEVNSKLKKVGLLKLVLKLLPQKHGERGNYFTEYHYFSENSWREVFAGDFIVKLCLKNKLAYTGNGTLHHNTNMDFRRKLSTVCGSSCHLFVLTPKSDVS